MTALDFFDSVGEDYGTEEDAAAGTDEGGVVIPRFNYISVELDDVQLHTLEESVNPLQECSDYGTFPLCTNCSVVKIMDCIIISACAL